MAGDNRTLGRFQLTGLPPAPRGVPQVEVTFDINADGILNVTAKDKATNKEQKIEIKASSGLDKNQIDKMVQEAAVHADEDKKKTEIIESPEQGRPASVTRPKNSSKKTTPRSAPAPKSR